MAALNVDFVFATPLETVRKVSAMQLGKTFGNQRLPFTFTVCRPRADCLEVSGILFY